MITLFGCITVSLVSSVFCSMVCPATQTIINQLGSTVELMSGQYNPCAMMANLIAEPLEVCMGMSPTI
jgi:hypothetical protein